MSGLVALVHSLVPPGPKRVDFLISWWWQQAGSRGSVCSLVNKLSENATCPSTGPATGHHHQQGDFPPKSVLGHVTWAAHCRVWSTTTSHGRQPGSDFYHRPLQTLLLPLHYITLTFGWQSFITLRLRGFDQKIISDQIATTANTKSIGFRKILK